MKAHPARIDAPPHPMPGKIHLDRWNAAKTPRQLWEALRTHPAPYELAQFILGSDSHAGHMFRNALLDVQQADGKMSENVARTLRAMSRDADETWAHLLRLGSEHCSDPIQAWRLFSAWPRTPYGEHVFNTWFQTTSERLPKSLDSTGLDTEAFETLWQERMGVPKGLNETKWIFQLGTLDDGRLLARQLSQSGPDAHASAAWTGLFNRYDDHKLVRLLEGVDLMQEARYSTLLPLMVHSLEQGLENVPTEELYEFQKAIAGVAGALDRYVQVKGELPPAPLDHLCRLIIPQNPGSGATPHIRAFFRRSDLLDNTGERRAADKPKI